MSNSMMHVQNSLISDNLYLSSYFGKTVIENLKGEYELSRPVTLCSGHNLWDKGNSSTNAWGAAWNRTNGCGVKTQVFSPTRFSSAEYWFVACTTSTPASITIYISNKHWEDDLSTMEGDTSITTINIGTGTDISDTANSRFTGTINDIPLSEDGMLYTYIASTNALIAGYGITAQKE